MGEPTSAGRERLKTLLGNPRATRVITYVLVPLLLLAGLWLPPISLGVRLFHLDLPLVTSQGGSQAAANGAQLLIAPGAVRGQLRLLMQVVSSGDAQAAKGVVAQALKALPANLELRGPLYRFAAYGSQPSAAEFVAPLPAEVSNRDSLDLYAWTGKAWEWLPGLAFDGEQIKATLNGIPTLLAILETKPQGLVVGVGAPDMAAINAAPLDLAAELYMGGLSLIETGAVQGEIALESAPASILVLPTLSNRVEGVARYDWVANLIANEEPRQAHVQAIVAAVAKGGYKGVDLDYAGLDPALREPFAAFVQELADSLHKAGKLLTVRVDAPHLVDGAWDTTGYDWATIGRAADLLRIPVLEDPVACAPGGAMEQMLRYATSLVDRQKLQLVVSAYSREQVGEQCSRLIYGDALSLASSVVTVEGGTTVLEGQEVALQVTNLGNGLQELEGTGQSWFSFKDANGIEHKVWIENSDSVVRKLALAGQFSLHGVAIDDLAGTANDARIWDTVRVARTASARGVQTTAGSRYSVVWKVTSSTGEVVDQGTSPADQPVINWTAAEPGEYTVSVAISEDGGQSTVGQAGSLDLVVPSPTPSPTPTNTPTPVPTAAPTKAAAPAAPAVAQAPAPSTGVGFGYGIQVDMITDTNYERILGAVQQLGFGWIKQQVEWFRFNPGPGQYDWGRLDAIVDACAARGIKVLFSVVKAPQWTGPTCFGGGCYGPPADPNTYATFMREMANRYKGRVQAYEIWNEQNLWYEWGGHGHRLSAAKYVELLRAAYNAIKSVDRGAIVISGAMTPTGWSDGDTAIDDQLYLRQMYEAGLRSVCDAVGIHPSGYNLPPDADWRTYTDPSLTWTAPQTNRHPSYSFRGEMEGYRNIMIQYGDGNKKIIPTEFGWASTEGIAAAPAAGYEYAADNSAQEQANYIVRAYQMGKNWGFVGPMFLWNLNFAPLCGGGDEKAAFSIVDCGWGARPAYYALANMPK